MRKYQTYLGSVLSTLVVFFLFIFIGITAGEKWHVISELPTLRSGFSTAVVDGKIYLIGGTPFQNRRGPYGLSTVEVYDPKTNRWEQVADMPTPRTSTETAVINGTIYVCGGYNGIDNRAANLKFLDIVEAYDPQKDTWTKKQGMSVARIDFGMAAVAGKIYSIGGSLHILEKEPEAPGRIDLVEAYDPATDTWVNRAKMPTRRSGVRVAVVRDAIYAIGGGGWPQVGAGGPFLTVIEKYDPKINRWERKNGMPDLRLAFSAVVLDDVIHLIGGFIWQNRVPQYMATVDTYNPETEEWSDIPPMPTPFMPFGAAVVDGNIYVFGGIGENREHFTSVMVFGVGFPTLEANDKLPVEANGKLPTRWGTLKMEREGQP